MAHRMFNRSAADPAEAAAIAVGKARDDLVATALLIAGSVRSHATDKELAEQLVGLVIVAAHYGECQRRLTALIEEPATG